MITDTPIVKAAQRRPWVTGRKLTEFVPLAKSTIQKYNALPNCPVVRVGNRRFYDVDQYMQWLRDGGPEKGRRMLARQLRERHG